MLFWLSNPIAGQVSTRNYIRTRTMLNETGSSYMDLIVYYDGLGLPFKRFLKESLLQIRIWFLARV